MRVSSVASIAASCLVLVGVVPQAATAAVILSDDFDDGAIGTNTGGVGTGFDAFGTGTVSESGNVATMNAPLDFQNFTGIVSKDLIAADGTTVVWAVDDATGGGGAGGSPGNKAAMFVQQDSGSFGNEYILLSFFGARDNPNTTGANEFSLVANDGSGAVTYESGILHGIDWDNDFTVTATFTATGYAVAWDDGASGSGSVWGNWTDQTGFDFNDLTDANGDFRVGAYAQGDRDSTATLVLDSITATAIPEPATVSLLAMGTAGLLAHRRHRRC